MLRGALLFVGTLYSEMIVPLGEILPILFALYSVNQRLLSGPAVMLNGALFAGVLYSVVTPVIQVPEEEPPEEELLEDDELDPLELLLLDDELE